MLDFHGHRIHFPLQSRFSVRFSALFRCPEFFLRFINYSLQTPLHQSRLVPKSGVWFWWRLFFFLGGGCFLLGRYSWWFHFFLRVTFLWRKETQNKITPGVKESRRCEWGNHHVFFQKLMMKWWPVEWTVLGVGSPVRALEGCDPAFRQIISREVSCILLSC